MKHFRLEPIAQREFEEGTAWYESQEPGLGFEFNAEIDLVLMRIAQQETFVTAPIATLPGGVVRREFVDRFPYVVVFVETQDLRKVIMIRRGSSSPARWKSRVE